MGSVKFIDDIKRKQILLHVSIWALFLCFFLMHPRAQIEGAFIPIVVILILNVLIFYINYSFLIPRFLLKKKALLYVFFVFVLMVISIILFAQLETKFRTDFRLDIERIKPDFNMKFRFLGPFVFNILLVVTGIAFRVYGEWNKNERTKKEIESQKFSTELHFLKHQLSPHFLFNSLNSIYSLTTQKSNDAPEAVITLSELMRYMLYETNSEFVSLGRELAYVQNYLKLQRLRIANNKDVTINIHGSIRNQKIRPLLFISFIENAFKYGTDYTGNTEVKIEINIDEDDLKFSCINIIGGRKTDKDSSGIGLQNTKERLEFLYPKKHELFIEEKDNRFIVNLNLKLD
ncbi:sensor histidine kinase [Thalassobellus citreus]|uniref:sensor histidine kinase n=1 Tax=Thalassobellus citreus TaxID=3367752 RepID=UPI00379D8373